MNKALIALLASLIAAAVFSSFKDTEVPTISVNTDTCTEALAVECAVDIEKTVKACAAAFETGGSDVIADIKCTRDLLSDKKHCWPCICYEAHKRGWKIIGC